MDAFRHIRNHIAHNSGIIPKQKSKLMAIHKVQIFGNLKIGDEIVFTNDDDGVYETVRSVKMAMDEIVIAATEHDPEYRKIWYLD
ncbi:hypothetical protein [Candidatus Halocynthiibacter alkanivorans]|uniref:hypothetical protein n=1 Tax=Candidatus Halocynthiibacter alkanivorans TaxID=2267619 RepID=UPI00109D3092|nr:hypothetical protein [Candidatus Halocynthiibacter alkanivorans]